MTNSPRIPQPVLDVLRSLTSAGHSAWLVGESLRELARGERPVPFEVATSLPPAECLHRHPRAVPTRLEEATVTLPTAAGPVDISVYRNGKEVAADLPFRDFTIHAMAYDPLEDRWLDPFDGLGDLRLERLRAVRNAADRLAEDPLRALRAARVCGELGFAADPALVEAMRGCAGALPHIPTMRARWELSRLLRRPGTEHGMSLLHESGLLRALFPGARAEMLGEVDRLPPDLAVRLAWSLRGTRPARALRRLGFGRICVSRVLHLLQHHPLEAQLKTHSENAVRRLLRRLEADDLAALECMRELELSALSSDEADRARSELSRLQETIARIRRAEEAPSPPLLGGREVMEILSCPPGPIVGEALDFLATTVAAKPEGITREELRDALLAWAQERELL